MIVTDLLLGFLRERNVLALLVLDPVPSLKDGINQGIIALINCFVEGAAAHLFEYRVKRLSFKLAAVNRYFYLDRPLVRRGFL